MNMDFKRKLPMPIELKAMYPLSEEAKEYLDVKDKLKELPQFPLYDTAKQETKVVYKYEEPREFEIYNEGNGIWRIESEKISRLFHNTNFDNDDSAVQFARKLSKMKIDDALREKGCKNGDLVFIEDYSFEFMDE